MQSFTQQFDNIENLTQPCIFGRVHPKYTDFITTEPPSIVPPPLLDIEKSPVMERCNSSPRMQNKISPVDSLLCGSERMKSARSVGQSAGPSGSPMSFKEASAVRPLQSNGQIEGPAVGNRRVTLSNFAQAATEGSELLVKESLLLTKNLSALNPESRQLKSPCNAAGSHASYRSGGQHSIAGCQLRRTKFKKQRSKIDRQHVLRPNQELVGCKKQLGQNFRLLHSGSNRRSNAKVTNIVQNLELIDLEHQLAEFQQQDRNLSMIADVNKLQNQDDIYQQESKDLPKIQDESSGSSQPPITQKQLVVNKKRQTWAQNVPTDNKTVWNVNAQEFVPPHLRQKEPQQVGNFDQKSEAHIMEEKEIARKTQQKPFDMKSPSKAFEEIQEDAASLTDESHSSEHDKKTDTEHLIKEFRSYSENIKSSGLLYCCQLKDIQETLQSRELIDACRKYGAERPADQAEFQPTTAIDDPLEGHMISSEFRTKMTDWMVEVCSSFNCQPRTYFLAVTIFDKYLVACRRHGSVQQDADVHLLGVAAIYLASKYEDVVPLHSKVVAEKIAHGAIEPKIITAKELEFLRMFEFQLDFATPFDFWQTYTDKVEKQTMHNLKHGNCGDITADRAKLLLGKLSDQCLLMVKMAMQCRDFMQYSGSSLVVAALYASTAFLKHSQTFAGKQTNDFVREVRRIIFQILDEEDRQTETFLPNVHVRPDEIELLAERKDLYRRQFNTMFVEQVAMDLVDYFKAFDAWHCGLNQLKKFHQLPID